MEKEIIIDNEYASLWFYPEHKIVHHKFHQFIHGDKFREVLMKGADLFEQKGCKKWLSDDRNNSALRAEDIEWGNQNWAPRVLNAGWKYWALMMPDKVLGKMNMRPLIDQYLEQGVKVEIFDDVDEALKWLSGK
jgi:hypothetical protein